MKKLTTLFFGVGLIALQGCSGGTGVEDVGTAQSELTPSGTASLVITSDWGTGYCANVTMQNALTVATTRWQVIIDLKNTAMPSAPWNTVVTGTTGIITAHPASYNTSIAAGSTTSFGFCGTSPVGGGRPVIKAWNMEANYFTTCQTNNG